MCEVWSDYTRTCLWNYLLKILIMLINLQCLLANTRGQVWALGMLRKPLDWLFIGVVTNWTVFILD